MLREIPNLILKLFAANLLQTSMKGISPQQIVDFILLRRDFSFFCFLNHLFERIFLCIQILFYLACLQDIQLDFVAGW